MKQQKNIGSCTIEYNIIYRSHYYINFNRSRRFGFTEAGKATASMLRSRLINQTLTEAVFLPTSVNRVKNNKKIMPVGEPISKPIGEPAYTT